MQSGESDQPARKRRIAVKEEDLDELYLFVQGAPYANTVLDARTSLAQKDYVTTRKFIESARDHYRQNNWRILRLEVAPPEEQSGDAQKEARRLKQRQDRCRSVVEAFDDIVSLLDRMIRLRAGKKPSSVTRLRSSPTVVTRTDEAVASQPVSEELPSEGGRSELREREILDMGAFSQLYDAAKRSGLVTNADLIAHARDREFRLGEYQKAFQIIEGLYAKFSAAVTQRDQRLRREDVDIASGKVRMSPKALLEKRARDIAQTQRVDRARNRFLRVLEGLRILMLKE